MIAGGYSHFPLSKTIAYFCQKKGSKKFYRIEQIIQFTFRD
jgi:hypothetical protein